MTPGRKCEKRRLPHSRGRKKKKKVPTETVREKLGQRLWSQPAAGRRGPFRSIPRRSAAGEKPWGNRSSEGSAEKPSQYLKSAKGERKGPWKKGGFGRKKPLSA